MNKLKIKKVGVLSAAKMYALVMLAVSLIISVPFGLMYMAFGAAMMGGADGRSGSAAAAGGFIAGLLMMIGLPIFYGAIGFVFGAIGAFIYNIFAGIVGGIEIEVESVN